MKKKRRFGRRVFCVLIVLFMGVIWQSDLLSQEPAEVRSLRKQEILQTDGNYREYYFGLLTEDEKKIYREMLSGIQERQDEFYLTSSNEQLITFDTELTEEFFAGFVRNLPMSLHIKQLAGTNSHHIIEGTFKAFGRTLAKAVKIDEEFADEIPSTKGVL